jgi:hypothetical protein
VISEDEYFVTFPSAAALRICMRGGEIVTSLNKMRINLKESDLDPRASSMLHSTWVKVFDIPSDARNEDYVKEISKTFGRPRSIDSSSLNGKGPVRVQVDCKDPKKLRGKLRFSSIRLVSNFALKRRELSGDYLTCRSLGTHLVMIRMIGLSVRMMRN